MSNIEAQLKTLRAARDLIDSEIKKLEALKEGLVWFGHEDLAQFARTTEDFAQYRLTDVMKAWRALTGDIRANLYLEGSPLEVRSAATGNLYDDDQLVIDSPSDPAQVSVRSLGSARAHLVCMAVLPSGRSRVSKLLAAWAQSL